jgi:hypothetical protein
MLKMRRVESIDPRRPSERRRQERQLALLRVALLHAGGVSDICVVRNVSPNGLSARVYRKLGSGEQVEIEFRSGELLSGSVVWERDCNIGIVFPRPIDVAAVLSSSCAREVTRRRALPRISIECRARLSTGLQSMTATLRDISQGGASLEVEGPMTRLGNVQLLLPDLSPIAGVVRWTSGQNVGVSFNSCIAFEQLARWIQVRREGLGNDLPARAVGN